MKIESAAVFGAGRVGSAMCRMFIHAGIQICAVIDTCIDRAGQLAAKLDLTDPGIHSMDGVSKADLIVACVQDRYIAQLAQEMSVHGSFKEGSCMVHTSGSAGLEPLQPMESRGLPTGVFHPFRSFGADPEMLIGFEGTFFGIMSSHAIVLDDLTRLAERLGGFPMVIPEKDRAKYHLAGVFASNFPIVLYRIATELLERCGIEQHAAWNAIRSITASVQSNLDRLEPWEAMSGPIVRRDTPTVRDHVAELSKLPDAYRDLYRILSCRIIGYLLSYRPGDSKEWNEIRKILDDALNRKEPER